MEIKGIDVSAWQGKIDWKTVADYGMGFAILRITEAGNVVDSQFENNLAGCNKYNIPVGVYKYSYAMTTAEIQSEARKVVSTLNGRRIQFPVFLDLEYNNQRSLGSESIHKMADAFREIVEAAGYKFALYCNVDWYNTVICRHLKKYDFWIARYPANDNGTLQERLRPDFGVGWQYSSKAVIPGISTKVDRNVFYKDYADKDTKTDVKEENDVKLTKEQIVQNVRNDAVNFAVKIASDNSHGYSQAVRSLYNTANPKSFDCSSLVLTAYYYAFLKNGLVDQANYLKRNCSYTGNMLRMLNAGFETVARNQTAHAQMIRGDIELNTTYHTALAVDKNNIVHARSSEGTKDTIDNSGNEIRTQSWYLYSHGWTHRLRFTGKGSDFSKLTKTDSEKNDNGTVKGEGYMFEPKTVKAGSKGTSVLLLQEILVARDFRGADNQPLSLDRVAGENTIHALNSYKKTRNMKQNGICDATVWKDLIAI